MIDDEWIKEKTGEILSGTKEGYSKEHGNAEGIIITSIISAFVYVIAKKIFEECIINRKLSIEQIGDPGFLKRKRLNRMIGDDITISLYEKPGEGILKSNDERRFIDRDGANLMKVRWEVFRTVLELGKKVREEDLP